MRRAAVLITGASGEIGYGLIERLAAGSSRPIVTLDVVPLPPASRRRVHREVVGSILDASVLERLLAEFEIDQIVHLAALLSTRAEFSPVAAHEVNVGGTINLLEFAQQESASHGRPVVFLYPSSIAVYGLPDLETKHQAGRVCEHEWNRPITMYGCNKLYCEQLGRYYARHYRQLSAERAGGQVDFRSLRFPGLLSAATMPAGGTSDYGSELVHAAVRGEPYACFVEPGTRIPFMAMPDAVEALMALAAAPPQSLREIAYNVSAFAPTAEDIRLEVLRAFPSAGLVYEIDAKRQRIVDSWPADVDVTAARRDWHFSPAFDFERTFRDYLAGGIARPGRDD